MGRPRTIIDLGSEEHKSILKALIQEIRRRQSKFLTDKKIARDRGPKQGRRENGTVRRLQVGGLIRRRAHMAIQREGKKGGRSLRFSISIPGGG